MNVGALIALLKLAQDADLIKIDKTGYYERVGKYYTETGAISRAKEGLGL
tara:strand:+ start:471 stop:620 length:150 start_codon:yes stop_codon:yes gene_type:complete